MIKLIPVLISTLIVALFLYSKLLPYKVKLTPQYRKIFDLIDRLFVLILNFLKNIIKPFQVGTGLYVDMSQIVVLIIFLILLNFF